MRTLLLRVTMILMTGFCLTLLAVPAGATIDLNTSFVSWPSITTNLYCRPDGQAQFAPNQGSFTIRVKLRDTNGVSIVGYPRQYIVLASYGASIHECTQTSSYPPMQIMAYADHNTDNVGETTFTSETPFLIGGQHNYGEALSVLVDTNGSTNYGWAELFQGNYEYHTSALVARTPDLNGDGAVNLSDVPLWADAYENNHPRGDFNFDGVVNLSDVPYLSAALTVQCP